MAPATSERGETLRLLFHGGVLRDRSDEEIERFKNMPDDDILRAANTPDLFAVAESMRRLKNALHREEVAIKRLTWALVILTVVLVVIAVYETVRHAA